MLLGTMLAFSGLLLTSLANGVVTIYITFGIMTGRLLIFLHVKTTYSYYTIDHGLKIEILPPPPWVFL